MAFTNLSDYHGAYGYPPRVDDAMPSTKNYVLRLGQPLASQETLVTFMVPLELQFQMSPDACSRTSSLKRLVNYIDSTASNSPIISAGWHCSEVSCQDNDVASVLVKKLPDLRFLRGLSGYVAYGIPTKVLEALKTRYVHVHVGRRSAICILCGHVMESKTLGIIFVVPRCTA